MGKKRSTSAEGEAQVDTPAATEGEEAMAPASTNGVAKARQRRSCCCGCCLWLLTLLLGAALGAASCSVALLLALDGGCGDTALAAARACMADAGQCTEAVTGTIAGCRAAAESAGGTCVAAVRAADGACASSVAKATAALLDLVPSGEMPRELGAVGQEVPAEPPAAAAATEELPAAEPLAASAAAEERPAAAAAEPPAASAAAEELPAAAAAEPPAASAAVEELPAEGAAAPGPTVTPAQAVLAVLDSEALKACDRSDDPQSTAACPDLHDAMLTWIYGIDHIKDANAGAQTGMQQYVDQITKDTQVFMNFPRGHAELRTAYDGIAYNNRQVFQALRGHFEPMLPKEPVGPSAPLPARGLLCRGGSCDAQ